MHKKAGDSLQGGWEKMLKQTSTTGHTGQLLACHMSGWSVECISPQPECDTNCSLPVALFVEDVNSIECNHCQRHALL